MNTVPAKTLGWPRGRWWGMIGLVLLVQMVLIFWLGGRPARRSRSTATGPEMRVVEPGHSELLALNDPTLFALPHEVSFSGPAWLNGTTQSYTPFAWADPPRWLMPPAKQLGAAVHGLLQTGEGWGLPLSLMPIPTAKPGRASGPELLPTNSVLRLTGELAGRELLTHTVLPSPLAPAGLELLTNSVVHLAVTPAGQTVAAMLLVSSGSKEADATALSQARAAWFKPLSQPGRERSSYSPNALSWGEMIFEWHTAPPPANNSVSGP